MMLQNNISFDTYFGRVLDPECYPFLQTLESNFGTNTPIHPSLKTNVFMEIKKYVTRLSPPNLNDYKQMLYYIFMFLLNNLKNVNIPIQNILKADSHKLQILLKNYLIPLLDLTIDVKKIPEYHSFAYEYILNNNLEKYNSLYIIERENEYTCKIIKIPTIQFKDYLINNNLIFNISGALFYNHDYKIGIMNSFLTDRLGMRKIYKKKRDTFEVGNHEYIFYDRRQQAMKINANSSYGLTGMANFLFSNRQLAMSTTLSGRLCLKISQICGEIYLQNIENQVNKEK